MTLTFGINRLYHRS